MLHSLVPLTVGMSGFRYGRFLAWTAPACAVWAALYIAVGSLAAGTYRELADQLHYAGYIFVAIIVVFIVLIFIAKKVIERVERKHLHADDESTVAALEDRVTHGRRERLTRMPEITQPAVHPKVLWLARLEYRFHSWRERRARKRGPAADGPPLSPDTPGSTGCAFSGAC